MGNALCALAFQAAAVTLGVYDWLLTLDQEVNLIWVRRRTPAKILFLVNRHLGLLYLLVGFSATLYVSPLSGKVKGNSLKNIVAGETWLEVQIFCMGIFVWIWLLQFTLLYRTFAIYSSVKNVKRVLIGGYIFGICTTFIVFAILFLNSTVESQDPSKGISCYFTFVPSSLTVFWLPSFVYGLIFVILSVRIAIKHAQYSTLIYGTRTAMWVRFVQDCILYFTITSAVLLGNSVAWVVLPSEWHLTPMGFSIVLICAAGNRLVFRLIQVYHGQPDDEQKSLDQIHGSDALPLQAITGNGEDRNRTSGSSIIVEEIHNSSHMLVI